MRLAPVFASLSLVACRRPAPSARAHVVRVAAASSLAPAFEQLRAEAADAGLAVSFSFGATGMLTRQIEEGAPFDLFAAADRSFADRLEREGRLVAGSTVPFARGRLVAIEATGTNAPLTTLQDLAAPAFRRIAIANPETAPFGRAAREALERAGVWNTIAARVVYADNVQQAYRFAATGNADAALTAASVLAPTDRVAFEVSPASFGESLVETVSQVRGGDAGAAMRVIELLRSPEGARTLTAHGLAPIPPP